MSPNRILLVRTDRLGDVILTLPMLAALRSCFPHAHLALLLRRYTGALLEGNPYVNEVLWYDDGGGFVRFEEMRRIVMSRRFDAVIVVYPTFRLAWLMFRSGIPVRVGTGYRTYSMLFNRRVFEHRKDALRHEVEYNLNLLRALGCEFEGEPEFRLEIPPRASGVIDGLLATLRVGQDEAIVILHPGSGGSAREWGEENFSVLAARLTSEPGIRVFVTGAAAETELAATVARRSGGRAESLAGRLDVTELAALISRSALFVGNSSGPIHIAAALGTPVVGLYPQHTPMSARRWGPYTTRKIVFTPERPLKCSDCTGRRGEPCACMQSIPVDDVFRGATSLLQQSEAMVRRHRHA